MNRFESTCLSVLMGCFTAHGADTPQPLFGVTPAVSSLIVRARAANPLLRAEAARVEAAACDAACDKLYEELMKNKEVLGF